MGKKYFAKDLVKPKISLVIPAYNEEKFLGKTLLSVQKQNFKDFEIIVVDNNSSDRTAAIAKEFGARVIFAPEKKVSVARQAGFFAAKAEIIATTDADTILPSGWLSRIYREFAENPDLVAFGGPFSFYSGSWLARIITANFSFLLWRLDRVINGHWTLGGVNLAVKKKAFQQIGGFAVRLSVGEDAEICQRLSHVGRIKFSFDHRVLTSGRRFRNGLLLGFLFYLPHYLGKIVFKKYLRMPFPAVRKEEPTFGFSFVLALIAFLLFFLGINYAGKTYARQIAELKEKIVDYSSSFSK
ncbi:MAG: Poly-beta-1,6-N-acetyl-D-glucosamine synthase [Microgenomates group bacterium ADurb.Bin219]|nr:MAG: Poly-beta-1,6-N-acetyl-D-glucosamine synthase [Microgenomates group bacterium ADurb.Bin219]